VLNAKQSTSLETKKRCCNANAMLNGASGATKHRK